MNLVKYGLGLLLLLTISCNSDDGIDLRKDRVLVKKMEMINNRSRNYNVNLPIIYKENRSFSYNNQALMTNTTINIQYKDYTDNKELVLIKSHSNISFNYKDKNLLDEAISIIDGKKTIKKFNYNSNNQLTSIDEEHRTTTFYYNAKNQVGQITMIYNSSHIPNSDHFIQYNKDGSIKEVYYKGKREGYYIYYGFSELISPFAESNINFTLNSDEVYKTTPTEFKNKYPDFMDNFEYIYKGDKLLKGIMISNIPLKQFSYEEYYLEILEVKRNLPIAINRYIPISYSTNYYY